MISSQSMQELMVSQSMQELMISPWSMQELMASPWSRYAHSVLYIGHRFPTAFWASLQSINSVLLHITSLILVIFNKLISLKCLLYLNQTLPLQLLPQQSQPQLPKAIVRNGDPLLGSTTVVRLRKRIKPTFIVLIALIQQSYYIVLL